MQCEPSSECCVPRRQQEGFLGEVTSELLLSKMILERNVRGAHVAEEPGEA